MNILDISERYSFYNQVHFLGFLKINSEMFQLKLSILDKCNLNKKVEPVMGKSYKNIKQIIKFALSTIALLRSLLNCTLSCLCIHLTAHRSGNSLQNTKGGSKLETQLKFRLTAWYSQIYNSPYFSGGVH